MSNPNIRKFNVENCDIRTQMMFEDWATPPCFKIMTLILARKGKRVFSAKGMGEMLGMPKSTTIHALKLLIENKYITKDGNNYYLDNGVHISGDSEEVDQSIGRPTNPLVEPTKILVGIDQSIGRQSTKILVTNNDKEIIIKNNEKEKEPAPASKFSSIAENSLTPKDDPTLQQDAQFINQGKRPMRSYPFIKLTLTELIDVFEQYEAAGIPIDARKLFLPAFKKVNSKIETKNAEGKSVKFTNAYTWLIGFAKTELLQELTQSNNFKRSELYLTKAN